MRRRGFTIVELMVTMGIITLLAAILLPVVARTHAYAVRTRMKADLATIGTALEAYRMDHRDYPRITEGGPDIDGAALLCWALIAPGSSIQDGADGPGFRLRGVQGQVYGPYLDLSHFRISSTDDYTAEIIDRNNCPIHYCPSNTKANPSGYHGYVSDYYGVGPQPLYDHSYFEYCLDLKTMRQMLGDTNNNGQIDPGETPVFSGPYILWCAGPNGIFGPDPSDPSGHSDDVTNFNQ